MITLPELPYAHDALEPHISKETLRYHHDKHHKAYVDNLNKLIKGTEFEDMSLDKIIKKSGSGPIFNNAAQVWNHTFYWNSMTPDTTNPSEQLLSAIEKKYGSVTAFQKEFTEKGKTLFGSGWVWLVKDGDSVTIETTHNAEQPKRKPLLVCDVWEHAYYLDTKNERPKYIENFFKVANWKFAESNW
jgi:Fe-Mn family superoxide dismutase